MQLRYQHPNEISSPLALTPAAKVFLALALALAFSPLAGAQDSPQTAKRSSLTATDESPIVYDLVTAVTIDALPTALQQELLDLQNAIRTAGQKMLYRGDTNATSNRQADEHYLILDASALETGQLHRTLANRLTAARAFPKDRRQAQLLFQKLGLRKGGLLPWVLVDHHKALMAAFGSQDAEAIAQEIAAIVHFSADAAMAFHVSSNGFASLATKDTRNVAKNNASLHDADTWWRGARLYQRCQVELLAWSRSRFEHEARVWPGRIKPIIDPIQTVFDTIIQAYEIRDDLSALDHEICSSLVISNEWDFSQRSNAYYLAMSERAGHLHRWQLENGALLAARLITDAWQRTGRLSIGQSVAAVKQPTPTKVEKPMVASDALVGSRNSRVFHRANCRHVKRIAHDNLVPFESAEAATRQGRRPCKTCKPK